MSGAGQYDPERHDNQIVAAFETVASAGVARDALVEAGVARTAIHIVAREAQPVESGSVGDQIMNAFVSLFSSHEDHAEYEQTVQRGHALLAVDVMEGTDRHRVVELLEQHGALDFEAQHQAVAPEPAPAVTPRVETPRSETPTPSTPEAGTAPQQRVGRREAGFGSSRVRSYVADRS